MLTDLRYALRTLRHNAGFAATAILSIGLGIGANSAIFSVGDALVLRPLSVPDGGSVVSLRLRAPSGKFLPVSYRDYEDYRDQSRSFASLVAFSLNSFGFAPEPRGQAQSRVGVFVSGNFFSAMNVSPALGRDFTREETNGAGAQPVIVLSHDLWATEFRSDPGVIGKLVRLNGIDHTVIGVTSESFTGMDLVVRPAFYVPAAELPRLSPREGDGLTNRGAFRFAVKGRLKDDVSVAAATAEVSAIAGRLAAAFPETHRAFSAAVRSELQSRIDDDPFDPLLVGFLFVIVLVVLAIACANVANLMLSRGRVRGREIAVRLAVGASRARLIRQFLMESLLISGTGGALGLLVAKATIYAFSQIEVVGDVPVKLDFQLDGRVLAFTAVISVVSALLFGLVPALRSTRTDLTPALKSGDQRPERTRLWGRNLLVTAQVAGSVVLVIAATQVAEGFHFALNNYPGFERHNRLSMRFDPSLAGYSPERTQQFYRTLMDRVQNVPGVGSAALTSYVPLQNGGRNTPVTPENYQFPGNQRSVGVNVATVDERYFATLRVPVLQGRGFLESDGPDAPRAIVVNQTFARIYFQGDAIGKRVRVGADKAPWSQVVGVVADGKYTAIIEPPTAFFYIPLRQNPETRMTLVAESRGDAAALAAPLKQVTESIDAQVPVFAVRSLEDIWEQRSVKIFTLISNVVSSIGALGLGLALVGLYAVVSYQVSRRTREIGVRMAVGADARSVVLMILRQSGAMGVAGVAIGMLLSFAGSKLLTGSPLAAPSMDMGLFVLVPLVLLLTTIVASAVPARRASQIDPLRALRQD